MRISDWSSECALPIYRRRLLARRLHVEAGLALPLGAEHAVVERAEQHHIPQHRPQPVGGELGIPRSLRLPVEIEDADETIRSAERRVGNECVSTCSSRWSQYH